ncbi:cobalt transporter CbiM [Psychromonas sp. B3M02]|uniref:cobalt transporter CbiM n=1 Tax=Psychromonas sp. B3M02 TaxID=2267226 RepID=UPI000DE8ED9D|nr:cobalt transporter CbiM [Psychromonas sp. B3M02]RBW43915.1 cobalt transporter CbiM [Psychromonas sp. B3M02]
MHIVDGALSSPVLISGAVLSAIGVFIGLKKMDYDHLPLVGVLASVFFIASYIHLPLGFSSVHLIMNGLLGIILGWVAFPALLVALLLQVIFFGFGGLLVLGVNTLNIALPAVLIYYLCYKGVRNDSPKIAAIWGAVGGAGAIFITALMVAFALALSGESFVLAAKAVLPAHIPIMVIEGFVSYAAVYLIHTVKPEFISKGSN